MGARLRRHAGGPWGRDGGAAGGLERLPPLRRQHHRPRHRPLPAARPGLLGAAALAIGICESFRVAVAWATPKGNGFNQLKEDYTPGDLGFAPLGLKPDDEQELFELQTKELNNGRLAMIAIAGFVAAELKSPGTEVFQHLFEILDYDLIKEVDLVEDIVGAPETPLPELDADTLSNLGFK